MAIRIAINGFGRIGRCVTRAIWQNGWTDRFELVHVNDITDDATLAHLLKYDSNHGRFPFDVEVKEGAIVVDGHEITTSEIRDPAQLPWKEKKVDIVLECTGRFRKSEDLKLHLDAGAPRVLLSAPPKSKDIRAFVYGVNHTTYDKEKDVIFSNASCTTNCLAPVVKVLHESFGIEHGFMTTVHSYTNDQRILDLPHSDLRRARAAALSMIPTTTGAAKAVGMVLPELQGKLDGISVRVPTPNVSLVDLVAVLKKDTSAEEVNDRLREASEGQLKGVLGFSSEPLVSRDFNGSPLSSIVDGPNTAVMDGRLVKVISWYDNEWGFSNRMLDMIAHVAG
ncbi:MAG: type I glyceraldehyde-3-phosphate dehydrogenase [Deltaproteobacteria bacterium]|nr:MAG: type I glyceraldehyde-3-phosphate dehydrogenase [Deltaproteobacteria bacterium]